MADEASDSGGEAPPPAAGGAGRTHREGRVRGRKAPGESRWPATCAVLAALGVQLRLGEALTLGPRYLMPGLEATLLAVLVVANPSRLDRESRDVRWVSLALIGLVGFANVVSLALVVRSLLSGGTANGQTLILSAVGIWLTNVIVFALWYWELDRGGPLARAWRRQLPPDFLFPQMTTPEVPGPWTPSFVDYLYLSATNSTAFSPTDTLPLTARAKLLMLAQSLASLATIALVAARAVNVLQ